MDQYIGMKMTPRQIVDINIKFKGMNIKSGMIIKITALDYNGFKYTVEGPVYTTRWWQDPYIVTSGMKGYIGEAEGGWVY